MKTNIHLFVLCRSFLLRIRNFSDKSCRGNPNTHFVFSNVFSKIVPFYEIMWRIIVERDRPQTTIKRLRIACWIPEATNTHSGCVILIAFPLQQLLWANAPQCCVIRTLPVLLVLSVGYRSLAAVKFGFI